MSLHGDVGGCTNSRPNTYTNEDLRKSEMRLDTAKSGTKRKRAYESRLPRVEASFDLPDNGEEREETVEKTVAVECIMSAGDRREEVKSALEVRFKRAYTTER